MRKRGSKKWWWIAAIVLIAVVWRGCRSSDERIETILHVKLARGVTQQQWSPSLEGATLLASEPLFTRSAAELAKDQQAASAHSGEPMPDLNAWRQVRVRGD